MFFSKAKSKSKSVSDIVKALPSIVTELNTKIADLRAEEKGADVAIAAIQTSKNLAVAERGLADTYAASIKAILPVGK